MPYLSLDVPMLDPISEEICRKYGNHCTSHKPNNHPLR